MSTAVRPAALPPKRLKPVASEARIAAFASELGQTEQRFSDDAHTLGLAEAFRRYGSGDAMNVGGGPDFTFGNEAIAAGFGEGKGTPLRWTPTGVRVASSGDLGFTYGYLLRKGPVPPGRLARIPWFTVWRRNTTKDPWLYVAE